MPFWSVLSLNCWRLFKIYTSYIKSKCRSAKMINIPCFSVPHIQFLSVQSYKRLKLGAFQKWLFRKTNGRNIRVVKINTFSHVLMLILRELKDIPSGEQLVKKNYIMSRIRIIIPFRVKLGPFKKRSRSFSFHTFLILILIIYSNGVK